MNPYLQKEQPEHLYRIARYAAAADLHLDNSSFAALEILKKGRGIANATFLEEGAESVFSWMRILTLQDATLMSSKAEGHSLQKCLMP